MAGVGVLVGESLTAGSISRIEAFRYRSLRNVSQRLRPFQVLLGPNGSGKSTLVDAIAFLCDLQQTSVEGAVYGDRRLDVPMRAPDAHHLTWMHEGGRFELALEATVPEDLRDGIAGRRCDVCRYEVAIDTDKAPQLVAETVFVGEQPPVDPETRSPRRVLGLPIPRVGAPMPSEPDPDGWIRMMTTGANTSSWTHGPKWPKEDSKPPSFVRNWADGRHTSLPSYGPESGYPLLAWFCERMTPLQRVCLSGEALRSPSPPTAGRTVGSDGGNLANFLHTFRQEDAKRYRLWIHHVREALPDIEDVWTHERPEDHHRYVVVRYRNGLAAPSWVVSEGTLRLLALTSLAYAPLPPGLCVIEEPENGIHPRALETVVQSLSSAYDRQILLATHSPLIARLVAPEDVLCFGSTPGEGTNVVAGDEHPRLQNWQGATDLGALLASGVL